MLGRSSRMNSLKALDPIWTRNPPQVPEIAAVRDTLTAHTGPVEAIHVPPASTRDE